MEAFSAPEQLWAGSLVFVRVASIVMLLPGLGEQAIPPRIRLSFALLLSMAMTPVVAGSLPGIPATVGGMGAWVLREAIVGLLIGSIIRTMMAALSVAGEIVSLQTTLSFAQTANPLQAQPGSTIASFLGLVGVTLVFATGLHQMFIGAIVQSYELFAPARRLLVEDAGALAVQTMGRAFAVGVQLSAPVMVFALVFNVATGLVGRVMPQFQIFFAATPLNVLLGLSVFALSLGTVGLVWLTQYSDLVAIFARGA
ncbi:MAG: flagellar type III secretion system protein FliR [Caulobacteraceae bacterium]|nr:flagellar type III secretion system protein FliR [Caulobacteraceae bacterium]